MADTTFDYISAVASTGLVGIFFLMMILRIKIMPTWVYDQAKADWERERMELQVTLTVVRAERKALVDEIVSELRAEMKKPSHRENRGGSTWTSDPRP